MDTRTQLSIEVDRLRAEIAALQREVRTDALTKVGNRRFADERLAQEQARARPCSVILLDVDFFKRVNDEHGHDVGDEVLRVVARTVATSVRASDDVCRVGGEEFLVICPGLLARDAAELAERLRATVEATYIEQLGRTVTISAGVAEAQAQPDAAVKRADTALYEAKRNGRNRVLVAA